MEERKFNAVQLYMVTVAGFILGFGMCLAVLPWLSFFGTINPWYKDTICAPTEAIRK